MISKEKRIIIEDIFNLSGRIKNLMNIHDEKAYDKQFLEDMINEADISLSAYLENTCINHIWSKR